MNNWKVAGFLILLSMIPLPHNLEKEESYN